MRLQHQGHVEARPLYQHVGYTAAAINPAVLHASRPAVGLQFGVALALVVMAMSLARRRQRWTAPVIVVLLLGVAISGGYGLTQLVVPAYNLSPEFTATIQTLERLSAATEAWTVAHGRYPTPEEWAALFPGDALQDAWGRPLEYKTATEPSPLDGQYYEIITVKEDKHQHGLWGQVSSSAFGLDGLYGTADDKLNRDFHDAGSIRYRHVDLSQFPHARAARTTGKPKVSQAFRATIERLERLTAATNAWTAQNGHRPNVGEWEDVGRPADKVDGWGRPFGYDPDGWYRNNKQTFTISSSSGLEPRADRRNEPLNSFYLGPDGRFGTADDEGYVKAMAQMLDLRGWR